MRVGTFWAVPVVAAAMGLVASVQLTRTPPVPVAHVVVARSVVVAGPRPSLPWPAAGQAAVAVEGLGEVIPSGAERPVPIASLTKMMTAYLVLREHPISPLDQGPPVVMSAADQEDAEDEAAANDSSIPVAAGEVLSERQLLDGLLVHSADNFADVLAQWDAGSVASFVAEMNSVAASLHMNETHYADASGLDPGTVSTPADQLRLAMRAMQIPAFAAVVAQRTVTLPIAGTVSNFVGEVGTDGIVGVKSGFTQAAMGCLVLAASRDVAGTPVEVLAAVTGEPGFDPLDAAAHATVPLLDATAASLRVVRALRSGESLVEVSSKWSHKLVGGVASRSIYLLAFPGDSVGRELHLGRPRVGAPAGTDLGTVTISVGGERERAEVRSTDAIGGPSVAWRLEQF